MNGYSQEEARKQAVNCVGTQAIFDLRIRKLKSGLNLIDYAGLGVPLLVGGIVLSGFKLSGNILVIPGILLTIQTAVFLWAVVQRWPERLENSIEARRINREQGELYHSFVIAVPDSQVWADLEKARQTQATVDEKENINEQEIRYGTRKALWQFQWSCGICHNVPDSLRPTKCAGCGSFPEKWSNK